ncbi:MAG: type II CRISPR RNA-guided endonuclease Cas9 [Oscillospiraceae bacterium]|nr:type II CRISPR RNA-guided endonuclease Cas9 [Oscillospiraceae bacterium]
MNNYYLGLDVGTNSVGYAVTDESYNPLKYKGKRMLGVSLFKEAELRKKRRKFRSARRRINRRKQRVDMVKELFAPEIAKVDEGFFIRLKESALWREDKSSSSDTFLLLNDENFSDKNYYDKYPTIHHLIMDLIDDKSAKDVRLVYLAVSWLVKHRGHFHSPMDENNIDIADSFNSLYECLVSYLGEDYKILCDKDEFKQVLKTEVGVTKKKEMFRMLFGITGSTKKKALENDMLYNPEAIITLLSGGSVKLKDLFLQKIEEYFELGSITLSKSLEELDTTLQDIGDDAELIYKLKDLFDWAALVNILGDEKSKFISKSKVEKYQQHKLDLKNLKSFVLDCAGSKETYDKLFKAAPKTKNYAAYIYTGIGRKQIKEKASKEEFYEYLSEKIKNIVPSTKHREFYDDMIKRIDAKTFLPKQKDSDNSVIPYQLYLHELVTLLNNVKEYLPFLSEVDDLGISVTEKIIAIFKFRIPYFVGVLNKKSKYSWVEFKNKDKIYPWNIESVVDYDKSEEAFINRMIGRCTYLPSCEVIPKNSLLYQKYEVLNEINNLKINGEPITVDLKQQIFEKLFIKNQSVTKNNIIDYIISTIEKRDYVLTGIDNKIKSSLRSFHAFKRLMNSGALTETQVEEIIKRITSTEDKKRLYEWIKNKYRNIAEEDIKYVASLKYKDYGRLSKEFLTGITGVNKETGQVFTIIEALWETNNNLMQLLSDKFTFKDEIDNRIQHAYDNPNKSLDEKMDELYLSNPVKRQIRKTINIVNEIVKVQAHAPKKIFIEMARGSTAEQKNKRTKTRKVMLEDLMKKVKEDVREIANELENCTDNQLQNEKLYLYFTQLGRCIYTGKPININSIIENRGQYDVDHIWPRSKVADDSINNKVLSDKDFNENIKGNRYPLNADVRKKMYPFWKQLNDNGFISDIKFNRLTRKTPFSADEMWGFINRQLVETRQSTKALTILLNERYPVSEIVFVKAGLVSEFRNEFDLLKSRAVNDLHHAKDAYLNIVVGNVYHEKFTKSWFLKNSDMYNVKLKALFEHGVNKGENIIWKGAADLGRVKKETNNNNIQVVANPYSRTGGFYDQMPLKAASDLSQIKNNMPAEKYGGYSKLAISYFILVRFNTNKKKELMFVPIEIIVTKKFEEDRSYAKEYIKNTIKSYYKKDTQINDIEVMLDWKKIKFDSVLSLDGYRMCIKGKAGKDSIALEPLSFAFYEPNNEAYIKRLKSVSEKLRKNANLSISDRYDKVSREENIELYDYLVEKLNSRPFIKRPNNGLAILNDGRMKFIDENSEIKGQIKTLLAIVSIMARGVQSVDLSFLKENDSGSRSCVSTLSLKLSNIKDKYKNIRIIEQSPTGLFEIYSENLLRLL